MNQMPLKQSSKDNFTFLSLQKPSLTAKQAQMILQQSPFL
jgi:hypothetical protein